jgi:hypothetical protein
MKNNAKSVQNERKTSAKEFKNIDDQGYIFKIIFWHIYEGFRSKRCKISFKSLSQKKYLTFLH